MHIRSMPLKREQFVSTLGEGSFRHLEGASTYVMPRAGEVTLIWPEGGVDQSIVVAVPAADMREFYAFTSTYVGTYSPFSAFFKVVAAELAGMLLLPHPEQDQLLLEAFIGLCVGEATLQVGNRRLADIPLQACLATQSAVGAAAIGSGYDPMMVLPSIERWQTLRSRLGLETGRVPSDQIGQACQHIIMALTDTSAMPDIKIDTGVVEFIRSVGLGRGTAESYIVRELADAYLPDDLISMGKLSREDRIRAFDRIQSIVSRQALSGMKGDVLLGYLASQVAGGSFNYLHLADTDRPNSLARLWFGLFASMHESSDLMVIAGCLGRQLRMKLSNAHPLLSPPSSDMSYEECLLLVEEGRLIKTRTEQQSVLKVDLFPGVPGRFRLDRETARTDVPKSEPAPSPLQANQLRSLRQTLEHAMSVVVGLETPLKPSDLFPDQQPQPQKRAPAKRGRSKAK